MLKSLLLASCSLTSLFLPACTDVVVDNRTNSGTSSGSNTSGSTGSGSEACAPGDQLVTFGASDSGGATLAITTDDEGVYWTNSDGSVWKAEPGGINPTRLLTGLGEPESIAVRGDKIFVVDYAQGLVMIDKQSAGLKLIAKGDHGTVATGPNGIYVADSVEVVQFYEDASLPSIMASLPGASSLAADALHVYVKVIGSTNDPSTRIVRVPGDGEVIQEIAAKEPQAYSYGWQELAIDDTNVYWVNPSQGTVMRVAQAGGEPTVLVNNVADPVAVATIGGEVYFTVRGKDGGSDNDRAVAKVPAKGGDITYLAHGPFVSAHGIAVDAKYAYWTAKYTGGPVTAACR